MARGDLTVFNVAKGKMLDGDWASSDHFYCALVTNSTTPTAGFSNATFGAFTEVSSAGSYTAAGADLGTLGYLVSNQTTATMTFDSGTNPSWSQNASNGTNAYWAIVYNYTDAAKDCLAFVDLAGPVDMTAGDLTITWNGSGLFTLT
jgi:hypothetical protein